MDLSYFDIVATLLILLLGLKGLLNGLFKELFGLLGIVGGIFVASRSASGVGEILSAMIFKFDNPSAVHFSGFLATLLLFWIVMLVAGSTLKKLIALSGLGVIDRFLGFIFASSKYFFVAAVIIYAASNVKALKSNIDSTMSSSTLYPVFVEVGGYIMKMESVESLSKDAIKAVEDEISSQANRLIDETKNNLNIEEER